MSHTESPDFDRMAEGRQIAAEASSDRTEILRAWAQDEQRRRYHAEEDRMNARSEIERLRAVLLNIQSLAESGFPIDPEKLATRCKLALEEGQ